MKHLIYISFILLLASCSQKSVRIIENNYSEKHRPQYHFSPLKGWMNDPNGLIYHDGEYHLFYQYYPDSTVWGPMHWAHAVSTDLVFWKNLPIALFPDEKGYIFSGSAVIDENNTAGFAKEKGQKPMVAIFTYHNMEWEKAGRSDRESQGIAYSLDNGRTWTKYEGNPVLKNKGDVDFRDPKVFWLEETKHWIMPLAVGDHLEIFTSPNLKDWEKASEFGKNEGAHGGVWECPDLFPLGEHWVLIQNMGRGAVNGGSGTQYFVGSFDGKTFKNSNPPDTIIWADYGPDNYAGITWAGVPDKRKIFIGWMSNWDDYAQTTPTTTWRSHNTVPRELTLQETPNGMRLFQMPVKELKKLRSELIEVKNQTIENQYFIRQNAVQKEVNLSFEQQNSKDFGFILSNNIGEFLEIGYNSEKEEFYIDRTKSGIVNFSKKFPKRQVVKYKLKDKKLNIKAMVDCSSIEIFLDEGEIAISELFFPNEDYTNLEIFSKAGNCVLHEAKVYKLLSIWK